MGGRSAREGLRGDALHRGWKLADGRTHRRHLCSFPRHRWRRLRACCAVERLLAGDLVARNPLVSGCCVAAVELPIEEGAGLTDELEGAGVVRRVEEVKVVLRPKQHVELLGSHFALVRTDALDVGGLGAAPDEDALGDEAERDILKGVHASPLDRPQLAIQHRVEIPGHRLAAGDGLAQRNARRAQLVRRLEPRARLLGQDGVAPHLCVPAVGDALAHGDDRLACGERPQQLAHAVLRREVAARDEDEHNVGTVDVLVAAAGAEIVHVQEDPHLGHHRQQPLLKDAHLVLPAHPDVRQKDVVPVHRRQQRRQADLAVHARERPDCCLAPVRGVVWSRPSSAEERLGDRGAALNNREDEGAALSLRVIRLPLVLDQPQRQVVLSVRVVLELAIHGRVGLILQVRPQRRGVGGASGAECPEQRGEAAIGGGVHVVRRVARVRREGLRVLGRRRVCPRVVGSRPADHRAPRRNPSHVGADVSGLRGELGLVDAVGEDHQQPGQLLPRRLARQSDARLNLVRGKQDERA
eukprot:scaffold10328_cov112-Isochrysis_galbana.AAC.4